jgi:hypothetical protein
MKPELRLFLLRDCVVNPPPKPQITMRAIPLVGLLLPKLIEWGIGGIATWLKKAGAADTEQVSATEFASFYVTDAEQRLSVNPDLNCILGLYGVFADEDHRPTHPDDAALKALEKAGLMPENADIAIVFEGAIVRTSDDTAFYIETRHFSVRNFIGSRSKPDRMYVATLSIATPDASADGATTALGNIVLGRLGREALDIPAGEPLGKARHYRSNLMPWNRITGDAADTYASDVKRNAAANKAYMPVTFSLTLLETADGNKFLAALGELLQGAKADAAKEVGNLVLPGARAQAAKEDADAAEKLYAAEENALIAVKEADAALKAGSAEQRDVLTLKLAKATRAYTLAVRLRKAAGLPDLP